MNQLKLERVVAWINTDMDSIIKKQSFQKMLSFYILNAPDKKRNARAKDICKYGIEDEADFFNELKISNRMIYKNHIGEEELMASGLLQFPPSDASLIESGCFASPKEKPVTNLLMHIRNSLAHGRFNIAGSEKDPFIIMEDINSNNNCSARLVIKLKTLIKWTNMFEKRNPVS